MSSSALLGKLAAVVLLLASPKLLQAFWDPPFITPASPTPTDEVAINVYMGDCDAIFAEPNFPQITQEGKAIHVVAFGQHWDGGELCNFTRGTGGFFIGSYAPGSYTVTFDLDFVDFFGVPQVETLGVVPFNVTGATRQASVPVPTAGAAASAFLLLGLLSIGLHSVRQSRAR